MNLLELTRSFLPSIGGIERFLSDRIKIYEELGIQYHVISTNFSSKISNNLSNDENVTIVHQYTPYNITPRLFKYLDNNYDVISVNLLGRYYSDISILYYSFLKKKIIVTPYFAFHTEDYRFVKNIFEKIIFKILLSRIDALIAFTKEEKKYWMKHQNVDEKKIFIIPPYILNKDDHSNIETRKEKYFLYLGRFENNKRIDLLLKAYSNLKDATYKLFLTLDVAELTDDLKNIVKDQNQIVLLGMVSEKEKRSLLKSCAALIFPTEWESFGYVAFEASIFKKPLLCSDIPVLREVLDQRGTLYFKNNVEDIINAIKKFENYDESSISVMGEYNYRNIERYSYASALQAYRNLFESLS